MPAHNHMQKGPAGDITVFLNGRSANDREAEARVIALLYKDLRRLANFYLSNERRDHTLQPTALVHEAYMRMSKRKGVTWRNRGHFFAAAAKQMRRILIDYARYIDAEKRQLRKKIPLESVRLKQISLEAAAICVQQQSVELLALHDALERLATWDRRQAQIVEMRFFGGLTYKEIAEALGLGERTIKRDWDFARAWLYAELTKTTAS